MLSAQHFLLARNMLRLQTMRFASTIHADSEAATPLVKMPSELMVANPWSLRPFCGQKIRVPVYEFTSGALTK